MMGTYGRYDLVCESLACFLQQTALDNATLLIYNQHPRPMAFDHPRVRVVNETPAPSPLRFIRQRMVELSDASCELIHFWDDDDLYLPWHLEDALAQFGDAVAWKPASSWFSRHNTEFERLSNTFEGSWTLRRDFVVGVPIDLHPDYTDHPAYPEASAAGRLRMTEFGGRTSYIYRWANGSDHLSGRLAAGSLQRQGSAVAAWRDAQSAFEGDGTLVPADLTLRWLQFLDGVRSQVMPADMNWLEAKLFPDAGGNPV
jgi:hypothetical protein